MMMAAIFAAITSILAFITLPLPFSPVPVTGQTLGIMLSGLLLGPKWGAVSQLIYLGLGAMGLPVFAGGGSGFGYLLGPTGGYLWGFIVGTYITGSIVWSSRPAMSDSLRAVVALLAGSIGAVYVLGLSQLTVVTGISFVNAISIAALPFLPGDAFKMVAAILIYRTLLGNHVYQHYRREMR